MEQMNSRLWKIIICCLGLGMAACNNVKHLPKNEVLYTGANVKLEGPGLGGRERKTLRSDLENLTRPEPNSSFLGLRIKLSIYNMLRNKKDDSFFGKLRDKWGEPPVLLSQLDLGKNEQLLQSHLENVGYFQAKVSGDTIVKNRRAKAEYDAKTGPQYKINSIGFPPDSSSLERHISQSAEKTLLKKGAPFNLELIKGERDRIDAYLKERGFYYFSPDYILVKADSTIGGHQVDLRVTIKPDIPVAARRVYRIDEVFIYSNYSLNTAASDTNKAYAKLHDGYYVVDKENKFKPSMFQRIMQFDSGDVYNRTDHNLTLNRLVNLNLFKFVKNRFEQAPSDSPRLNAYYYLTPQPKKSIRAELNANTKSNNLSGTQITVGFHNRNAFRGGEHLNVNVFGGTEVQISGAFTGYNTFRGGAEVNFTIPRFVVPFIDLRTAGGYVPRTNIQAGYELLNRRKLFSLNSFRGAYGYIWKNTLIKQHEFYPVSVTYVQPVNVTEEYNKGIIENPTLRKVIDTQFILGATYQFNYNQQASGLQPVNAFYFNGLADVSGNLAGLLTGSSSGSSEPKKLFNAVYSQYVRLETDFRYYRKIGLKSSWANRVLLGYGLPYGNSDELPFVKQFFVGGSNSLRAFRSRAVGPGSYRPPNTTRFIPDQTGDIKMEFNTEWRPHLSGPFYGAVFVDAGNIWLKNENPLKPGAKFSNDFLNDLAVGTGVGFRLDIVMFVIRLDVAFPLRKPWEADPWVINDIDFGSKDWRKENIIFNLGIGYPF